MLDFILLLGFVAISSLTYLIDNLLLWEVLLGIIILIVLLVPYFRRQYKRFAILFYCMFFTLFATFIMNLLLDNLESALLYTSRLAVMSILSLLFCAYYKLARLKKAMLFAIMIIKPFNYSIYYKLSNIINIGISLIPTISNHFTSTNLALLSKNYSITVKSVLHKPQIIINVLTFMMLNIIDELELSLRMKGVN